MKILIGILLGLWIGVAHAEIYKHVDENGHVTYSNTPMKGAKPLNLEPPVSVTSPDNKPAPAKVSPANFPKVDKVEQAERDAKRREILEQELAAEQSALEAAREAYAEGEKNPEVFKTTIVGKDGKPQVVTRRNVAKFQEKMQRLQDQVDLHEQNISLIEKELATLK